MPKATQNLVPVKYVGRRPDFFDRIYGSGLFFDQGQMRWVPSELARKLLRHADLFERGEEDLEASEADTAEILADAARERDAQRIDQSVIQDLRKVLKLSRLHSLSLEGRLQQSLAEHRSILQHVQAHDAAAAERAMYAHIISGREALARMEAQAAKNS